MSFYPDGASPWGEPRHVKHRASDRRGLLVSEQRRFKAPGAWVVWYSPVEYCSPRPTWHPAALLEEL